MDEEWPTPCLNVFEEMVMEDTDRFIRWIESGVLEPTQLTFAVELLGKYSNPMSHYARVIQVLVGLSTHPDAIVREGVVYGFTYYNYSLSAIVRLTTMLKEDNSENVRFAVKGALEDI
jgi:hypothetical protein